MRINARHAVEKLLAHRFAGDCRAVVQQFLDGTFGEDYLRIDSQLGDLVRDAMDAIGEKNSFHRLLVV